MAEQDEPLVPEQVHIVGAPEGMVGMPSPAPGPEGGLRWVFVGSQGLRAGWSILIFAALFLLFARVVGLVVVNAHLVGKGSGFDARTQFFSELVAFLAMVGAGAIVALVEHRSILDFNLRGPRRSVHFAGGLVTGFAALSLLVGALCFGGWLHFGPVALSGPKILAYAAAWGAVFLLVGFVEEGTMRCYLMFTLTRGINFWLAAGISAAICLDLFLRGKGNGVWGVYALALLGFVPCLLLDLKKAPGAGFWEAAWVTSTFFGFAHTGNNGENWIGIFTAGFVGFVFCVSLWLTGSAWWAIGCHAAWDWAETYLYGTADSGFVAKGHFLSTSPAGNPLWSGGADGPEGSLMVLPVIVLVLAFLLVVYRRKRPEQSAMATTEPLAS
jgi:membrane protease YdiL (CAAX protease family)